MDNTKEKKQLKKWQKALIGIGISIGVILVVAIICFIIFTARNNDTNVDLDIEETTTSVYELEIELENGKDDKVDLDTTPVNINLSDKGLNEFKNYVSSIDVDYDYDDVYNIDEALKLYNDNTVNSVTKHSHDIRVNGEFDADEFYKLVKKNNKAFIEKQKADDLDGIYEEYSNKQLKKICSDMMEAIPAIAKKDPTVDVDKVCCYLYNLVIMKRTSSTSFDFGGFTMDNRFYLNYDFMDDAGFAVDSDNIEETTFYHEMMHAYQFACDDIKKSDEDRSGIIHSYNELDINPLSWFWLLEGSAEMNMSQYLDVGYSTYKPMISYIESLNFISNIGSDNLVQTEKLCFQPDMEKLFEQLGANTDDEKREIIKMMYSIEIIQKDEENFFDWYSNNVNSLDEENGEVTILKLTLKEDALLTLTKIFYRNLAQQVNTGNATLQDVYYLMRVFEADLDRHFSNSTVGYMEFYHNFYDTYVDLQEEFLQSISKENNLNLDTVINDFENYSMNSKTKSPNCDLAFLNSDSKDYITTTFVDSFYKKGYPSIRSCKKQATDLDKKYSVDYMIENRMLKDD